MEKIMDIESLEMDENGNYINAPPASYSLKFYLQHLQCQFDELGAVVKKAVETRRCVERDIGMTLGKIDRHERYKEEYMKLTIEFEENGVTYLEKDPLEFIDSDYPFFQDENECELEDISNIEDPERCMEAMNKFGEALYENLHRFKHLPIGPLYNHMRVKKKKWAPMVEHILRPYLFSFIVDNIVDGLVMEELISEHFPDSRPGSVNKQGVIVPKHFIFPFNNDVEISQRITAISGMELENLLEVIQFDHENWGKFLSQEAAIEKTILMETENAAFLVMSHIKSNPGHCNMAYTLDGFQVHPFPNFRTLRFRFHRRTMYLKCMPDVDVGEIVSRIRKLEEKLTKTEKLIMKKRRAQLKYAKQIDSFRAAYESELEKEAKKREKEKQEEDIKKPLPEEKSKPKKKKKKAGKKGGLSPPS